MHAFARLSRGNAGREAALFARAALATAFAAQMLAVGAAADHHPLCPLHDEDATVCIGGVDPARSVPLVEARASAEHSATVQFFRYAFPTELGTVVAPCAVILADAAQLDPCVGMGGTRGEPFGPAVGPVSFPVPTDDMVPVAWLAQGNLTVLADGVSVFIRPIPLLCTTPDCSRFP